MKKKGTAILLACLMAVGSMGTYKTVWGAEKPLDDATKAAYYQEYQKIVAEVAAETNMDISILPMEEFTEEDWMTPKEYRKLITAIANWDMQCDAAGMPVTEYDGELAQAVIDQHRVDNQSPEDISTLLAEKQMIVEEQKKNYRILVTGKFTTQYNVFTDRQEFSGLREISSSAVDTQDNWTQTGYQYRFIDCGRTCVVTVFGEMEIAGIKFPKSQTVEFYCSDRGEVA